jgi:hypothetical protein
MQHKLSSEALRRHEALVRRTSGGRVSGVGDEGRIEAHDYADRLGAASPVSERSYSESLGGSIHSAPEFTAPPSPASLPAVRFEDDADEPGGVSPTVSSPVHSRRDSVSFPEASEGEASGGKKGKRRGLQRLPSTLWDYLLEEVSLFVLLLPRSTTHPRNSQQIFAVEVDGEEGIKSERVTNFLTVPRELEKVRNSPSHPPHHGKATALIQCGPKIIVFGVFICLDSFLYTFTILPLRAITALLQLSLNSFWNVLLRPRSTRHRHLRLSHKCDLTKAAILAGTLFLLHRITDASKMYHGVRGQETIKLYVLFNVLEVRFPPFPFPPSRSRLIVDVLSCVTDRRSTLLLLRSRFARLALFSPDIGAKKGWKPPAYSASRSLRPQPRLCPCVLTSPLTLNKWSSA